MHADLTGEAGLHSVEARITISGAVNKLGHVLWSVELRPIPAESVARLTFGVEADQSYLPRLIEQVEVASKV